MIYIGADHAGFKLKEELKKFFKTKRLKFLDLGNFKFDQNDDYPIFALAVAQKVARSKGKDKGILICDNGQGVCITANKVKGIRAVTGYSVYAAKTSRTDDDANILCLAGRVLNPAEARRIVGVWLNTKFSGAERHKRRLAKVRRVENIKN